VLPLSSSFGLTGTVLVPAMAGVAVVHHHDALDAPTVGRLVATHAITILPAAPEHLRTYAASVPPAAFRGLRHVFTAGERLPDRLRARFVERFGIEPLQGFGREECAPLISLDLPVLAAHARQTGARPGTLGQPLPGVAVRIVDPRTGDLLPPDREGLLLVKGPNVMLGYLDDPAETARVLGDGWFRTGCLARQDANGFLTSIVAEPGGA
jgi:acyl-[acyl-carrier-protein]-phospholipid O-acyltransferase/long-chain-fatty-acid--[acyl-carrier-protein] ligase